MFLNELGFELVSGLVLGLVSLAQNHYLIGSGLFFKPQKSVLDHHSGQYCISVPRLNSNSKQFQTH